MNVEPSGRSVDIGQLTASDFEQLLNSKFSVDLDYLGLAVDATPLKRPGVYPPGAEVELELVEVTRRKPYADDLREPFTLLFLGSHEVPLYGDVHLLAHPALGKMTLLLSAVNASPGIQAETHPEGRFYECVIS